MLWASRQGLLDPAGSPPAPNLGGLAVASPPSSFTQDELLDLLGLRGNEFAELIFARCGVERRNLQVSPEVLSSSLQERTPATEEQLFGMAVEAVEALDVDPAEIGVLVTANYYSLGGPTLAHRLLDHLGLGADVDKYHLVGVGCASAVPLFRLAGQALRDRPGQRALVVAAECVTGFLTTVGEEDEKVKIVGSALFGDGCGAALLDGEGDAPGPRIAGSAVHQVPGTLDHVRFAVESAESHMRISRELPAIAQTGLEPLVAGFLAERGLGPGRVDHWIVHPGGRGIIEGVQSGLGLDDEQVETSFRVLREHGNVGTPASFFVLDEVLRTSRPGAGELGCMVTIGPGVTIGLMLIEW